MNAQFYDAGVEGLLTGDVRWERDQMRVALLRDSYTFSSGHVTLEDIAKHVNGISGPLDGCVVAGRTARASETYVIAQQEKRCRAAAVFQDTGDPATSTLVTYSEIAPAMPVTGQRVDVSWPDNTVFRT